MSLILVLARLDGLSAIHYVNVGNLSPTPPYGDWKSAATNIQDAIDVAAAGDEIVVTNGVYKLGSRAVGSQLNRVAITKPVTVRSVNGPAVTLIEGTLGPDGMSERWGGEFIFFGSNSVRCVYVGSNAVVSGFTLTNGFTIYGGSGGGAWCENSGVVSNCSIVRNSAHLAGGGIYGGSIHNSVVTTNSALWGGGVHTAKLRNSAIMANRAFEVGGGVADCEIYNCTVTGNSAIEQGGGVWSSSVFNSIVFWNEPHNYSYSYGSFDYSCTHPLPSRGTGNIADDPQLASTSHISADSPCLGAGSTNHVAGTDIDGEPWTDSPSIGADQLLIGAVTGPMVMSIDVSQTNFGPGFVVSFIGHNTGPITHSVWDFRNGTFITNQPYVSHTWSSPGVYPVRFTGYNEMFPNGVTATATVHVVRIIHYVNQANRTPTPPYTSWETAATNIQEAIDASTIPQAIILVTNGVYSTGGRSGYFQRSRVVIGKALLVQSVNGPTVTKIEGAVLEEGGPVRCADVADGATLSGFTLLNGHGSGSGAYCFVSGVVSNCVVTGNHSTVVAGGVFGGRVYNSLLISNTAVAGGGGAYGATLINCTLVNNVAERSGGGTEESTLYNCISFYNSAPRGRNFEASQHFNCCTTPLPLSGTGNITNEPLFANISAGNLRLQSNSPCVNAGTNTYASTSTDLDGRPRIGTGIVDIGAYELHPGFIEWLQEHGLPIDGSADMADSDGDGRNNWEEWRSGTAPNNRSSVLRLSSPARTGLDLMLVWAGTVERTYFLQRITSTERDWHFETVATNVPGQSGLNSYVLTNALQAGSSFYRLGVE